MEEVDTLLAVALEELRRQIARKSKESRTVSLSMS
jgi:hypothetical protein